MSASERISKRSSDFSAEGTPTKRSAQGSGLLPSKSHAAPPTLPETTDPPATAAAAAEPFEFEGSVPSSKGRTEYELEN
eukprot:6181882-Karenia_brevis.AAC.1